VPRRTRTRQARRAEARAQLEREEAYAELEEELHYEWRHRPVGGELPTVTIEPASDVTEPETSTK